MSGEPDRGRPGGDQSRRFPCPGSMGRPVHRGCRFTVLVITGSLGRPPPFDEDTLHTAPSADRHLQAAATTAYTIAMRQDWGLPAIWGGNEQIGDYVGSTGARRDLGRFPPNHETAGSR